MRLTYTIKTAVIGLKTHKSRAFLTILGIVIGIASIMSIMSLGSGAKNLILDEIQGTVGSRVIEIRPGREPKGPNDMMAVLLSDSLKMRDVEALRKKSNVPNIVGVMPLVLGSEVASFESEVYKASLYGMSELASRMYNMIPSQGSFITAEDVKDYSDVVVIGSKIKENLFPNYSDVVGQKIKIKGRNFKVIGVLPEKGQGFISFDEVVVVPYTTAQQYILGKKYFQHIIVEADAETNVPRAVADIKTTLRDLHNITDPDNDDFSVSSQADAMKMVGSVMSVLTTFLAAVAAISLVVGGVGIMNIMLVSVTERTREIGLRKAVGATNGDILKQFLVEASVLTFFGGLVGIIIGLVFSVLASWIIVSFTTLAWRFTFPYTAMFLGLAVSVGVGLLFGLYPAKQAAKKSPMEALRYE